MYRFPNVQAALARRLAALAHPAWTQAMTALIAGHEYFRWHDSGDVQSSWHLKQIFEVCNNTPDTAHWLPTQERQYLPLPGSSVPSNLLIRLSNAKIDTKPGNAWSHWSTVVSHQDAPIYGATRHLCPAPKQGGKCKSCRACWDKKVHEVQYLKH